MAQTYWTVQLQRTVPAAAFVALIRAAQVAGKLGMERVGVGYTNAPNAKNLACQKFLGRSQNAEDTLVALQGDRACRPDILPVLAGIDGGVVMHDGALAIKRWALERLQWAGHEFFFKHKYPAGQAWKAKKL